MTDWISFVVGLGFVTPWLLAGVCMFTEWICKAMKHCWRLRTDPIYREVEIQFRADIIEAGLDGKTNRLQSILWWLPVLASAGFLSRDVGWIHSMRWLWAMSAPMVALEIAAILVAAICLNLVTISFVGRLRALRDPMDRFETDDSDDLLRAAEALSAQYDAIAARLAGGLSKRDRDRRARRALRPCAGE